MAKLIYESALKNSGFSYSMKFERATENGRRNKNISKASKKALPQVPSI